MKRNNATQTDELALWQAFKRGDKAAFGSIYERYIDALLSYGYYFTKDKSLLEDAIQELFMDLWRMKANLSDTNAIKYYLFRSLQRKICHLMDTESVFVKIPETLDSVDVSIEERIISQEQAEEYQKILSKGMVLLPQRQLQAVHLRFFDNLETREIADIMGMNEQSVRNIIQRALQKLRLDFTVVFFVFIFLLR